MEEVAGIKIKKGGVRFFRKAASLGELEKFKKMGKPWVYSANNTNRVIGKNNVNKLLKRLADMCGYTNPMKCTAHGKRRAGISHVVNQGTIPLSLPESSLVDILLVSKLWLHIRSPTKNRKMLL